MAVRVGINGFGRIGRLALRAAEERGGGGAGGGGGGGVEFVAVNDLVGADNLAYLLKHDTMHGRAARGVSHGESSISYNNREIKVFAEKDPSSIPWGELGVDYVLESTGLFTKVEDAKKHIEGGAKRVMISAPTKSPDEVPTLCYKVNHEDFDPGKHTVISNASCTTNCLAPIAKVIHDGFGLEEGLMSTIHAATATQPTQDGPSKKDMRGGRNAYMNIIPASTGAAKATALCIPQLKGKITGMAFRVPTADVSVVDLTFRTEKATSLDAINDAMKKAAEGPMAGVLEYCDEPVVSSDFVTHPASSIYDSLAGMELSDRFFKVVSWYDNEWGYASRCVDMLEFMAKADGIG